MKTLGPLIVIVMQLSACGKAAIDPYRLQFPTGALPPRAVAEVTLEPGAIVDARLDQPVTFEQMVATLGQARVILIGESHDDRQHHTLQAKIIEALASVGSVAIGLEMLPRAEQPALERYIDGAIDDYAFVKEAKWYDNWGISFRYYRPIFHAARKLGAKMVALNAPRQVVRTVGRKGLAALNKKQRRAIPEVYPGSPAHRRFFDAMLGGHGETHKSLFDRLQQAQSVWDETMADSVLNILAAKNPPRHVVVIAGSGHVAYGLGIGARLRRRAPALSQAAVVCLSAPKEGRAVSAQVADYLFGSFEAQRQRHYPSLGLRLKEKDGGVRVRSLAHGALAKRYDIKKGDRLLEIDGQSITSADRVRWAMEQKRWGDTVKLTIERRKKILRETIRLEPQEKQHP